MYIVMGNNMINSNLWVYSSKWFGIG